ncbi:MAG: replication protein, partial [Candidatus Methylumidiphilus sp.]
MLAYRQHNYKLMMELSSQLCRWLHKYICIKFTQASLMGSPFEIHYKTIKRDSGLLARKRERTNFTDIEEALDELKEKCVICEWTKTEVFGIRGKRL